MNLMLLFIFFSFFPSPSSKDTKNENTERQGQPNNHLSLLIIKIDSKEKKISSLIELIRYLDLL